MGKKTNCLIHLLSCLVFLLGLAACGSFQNGEPYEGFGIPSTESGDQQLVDVIAPEGEEMLMDPPVSNNGGQTGGEIGSERNCEVTDKSDGIVAAQFFVYRADYPDYKFVRLERVINGETYILHVEWKSPNYNLDFGRIRLMDDSELIRVESVDMTTKVVYEINGQAFVAEMTCH